MPLFLRLLLKICGILLFHTIFKTLQIFNIVILSSTLWIDFYVVSLPSKIHTTIACIAEFVAICAQTAAFLTDFIATIELYAGSSLEDILNRLYQSFDEENIWQPYNPKLFMEYALLFSVVFWLSIISICTLFLTLLLVFILLRLLIQLI